MPTDEQEVSSMLSQRRPPKELNIVFEAAESEVSKEQDKRYRFRELLALGWDETRRVMSKTLRKLMSGRARRVSQED